MQPKVKFYGGVGSVTGANFYVEFDGLKFLVDCGLFQGGRDAEKMNEIDFPYDPSVMQYLFITHSHMDHIGRIPKLVRDGFNGRIVSTPETREISMIMLEDAYRVMLNREKMGISHPFYEEKDIRKAMSLWECVDYHTPFKFGNDVSLYMFDAGHILGSAMFQFSLGQTKIMFTGDLGNSPSPLLSDTEIVKDCDYLVMESVYGDKNHESKEDRREKFKNVLKETIAKGGDIIIPAFSIERTQVILFELNNMIESGELKSVPVYLDSPLAIKVTDIYRRYSKRFNEEVKLQMHSGDNIFNFPKLNIVMRSFESRKVDKAPSPKIIIAGSGMSEGGRVRGHETVALPDSRNTILLMGYQPVGTLGRELLDGAESVDIDGETVDVKARIEIVRGYSSHKDSDNLIKFVEDTSINKKLKKVFVCMGEPSSALFLAQRLHDYLGVDAIYPEAGKEYLL